MAMMISRKPYVLLGVFKENLNLLIA